jgi:uncharacterized protein YndB with AHSA1/START domain
MTRKLDTAARSVADVNDGVILARVEIAAPPERVFRALTTEELTKWWGAEGVYRTTKFAMDLRPGGKWRTDGVGADGHAFHVEGEIVEVDPPRRLVHTWKPTRDEAPTLVAYTLDPIEGGTRVTVQHSGFAGRAASCDNHAEGWRAVLGWLGGHVAPAPERRTYFVRLIPPRPTFAQDMNADERAMMMEHVAYWRGKLADGAAIAFGPVLDPAGGWGLGLVRVRDEAELRAFQDGDPAIRSGRGFRYETLPLARLVH